jgi:tRNA-dihydrouridine synthase 3
MMVGRGALIKPWIFQEFRERRSIEPTAEERVEIYHTFRGLMREQFGDDELGKKRFDDFFPWHMGFFCRYRPLPEEKFGGRAITDPLLQSRLGFAVEGESDLPLLEQLLRCEHEDCHVAISETLWNAVTPGEAVEALESLAKTSLSGWRDAVASGDRRATSDTVRG